MFVSLLLNQNVGKFGNVGIFSFFCFLLFSNHLPLFIIKLLTLRQWEWKGSLSNILIRGGSLSSKHSPLFINKVLTLRLWEREFSLSSIIIWGGSLSSKHLPLFINKVLTLRLWEWEGRCLVI